MTVRVTFDGDEMELPDGSTVADLLRRLDLSPRVLSVVRNGHVVRRTEYARTSLAEGDELTAVVQVGGG